MNIPLTQIESAVRLGPPTIAETVEYVRGVYGEQIDRQGRACWHHPLQVMLSLPSWVDDDARRAAMLHDVVEDTAREPRPITIPDLARLGHTRRTCDIVGKLTFCNGPTRDFGENVRSLIATGDLEAILIKTIDMRTNRSQFRNRNLPDAWQRSRAAKYDEPYALLQQALERLIPAARRFGR